VPKGKKHYLCAEIQRASLRKTLRNLLTQRKREHHNNQITANTFTPMAKRVLIKTSCGDITVRLYDETPLHRDNFLKLAAEGYYNGTLFHRVIKDFMVQGGDPDSKGAPAGKSLGVGGPDYTIPAEFVYPQLYHKKGALAAARQGDEVNPEKRSSGSQFYIVTGQVYKDGQLAQMEKQMEMQHLQGIFNGLVAKHRDEILTLRKNRDQAGLQALQEKLEKETYAIGKEQPAPKMTPEQREAYTTVGGTPFLDNQYTVFGEVESGLEVVDAIQAVATGAGDRPKEDVSMTMEVIED
jgi:peptidyl-prolyl cis-trans isomerase B (cyclophilin B)